MKNLLALPLFALFFSSCQPEKPSDPTPSNCTEPVATFQYKFNGTLIQMIGSLTKSAREGSLIRKEQTTKSGASNPFDNSNGDPISNSKYLYSILATKNYYYSDDGEPILEIELRTANFTAPKTYTTQNGDIKMIYTYYPQQAGEVSTQPFTINITKIQNGYADGNFNGSLRTSSGQTVQITEGSFTNVKILE